MVGQRRRRWTHQSRTRTEQETRIKGHCWSASAYQYLTITYELSLPLEPAKPAVDPNKSTLAILSEFPIETPFDLLLGTPYIVTVQTGSVMGAGTDAKVFLTMNGDKNKVMKYQLQKPEGGKNAFEKGNNDVFKFNEGDVGRVRSLLPLV
jgi:PLAT/LH2 domain